MQNTLNQISQVKILGHWEIGYHAPITEQYYWAYPIRDFGLTDWNMIKVSGIRPAESQVTLTEWKDYHEFFDAHPDLKRVFVEPRSQQTPDTIWLHDYEHPESCVYVFGSAHYNPTIAHNRDIDDVVSIKTVQDSGVLWADQAMSIILYDRYTKNGSNDN